MQEANIAMKSKTFYCPHCKVSLTKSAAAQVLGEADKYIAFGSSDVKVTCPGCGGTIDAQAMIDGKYDKLSNAPGWVSTVAYVILVVVTLVFMGQGESFWVAALIGLVFCSLFEMALRKYYKNKH